MAKFDLQPKLTFEVKMTLTEDEAYALLSLAYAFEHAIDPYDCVELDRIHEEAFKSLFDDCSVSLAMELNKVKKAKECLR